MDYQADTEIYPAGTVIGGYEILSHLASGGMAHVYIALQNKLSRKVAFKVLSSAFSSNVSVSKRFINEALIVAKLHHPHIVEVYDVGETEDHRPFMAMELLEGKGLGARIKEGPMSPAEAFPIVREVAESLAEAHAKGIIHRDLKPDNIFLTLKSGVKTLDFGIAKVLHGEKDGTEERLTRAGTAPGTPEYMSPEQARGQDLDARSDLYSLGIVLYEMLKGRPPFEEATFLATILMQVQSPPPPLPDTVPEPLAKYIINRLLAKDPNCRPNNAEEFIKELDELGQQLKIVSDNDGKTLMNALNEIELLRLQLAQTQQELQRSRDMACIDEADLEGPSTMPQVSVVPVGAPSLGDASNLVVNPNLGLAPARSGARSSGSMVPKVSSQGSPSLVTAPSGAGKMDQNASVPPKGVPAGVSRSMPPALGNAGSATSTQASGQNMRSGMVPSMSANMASHAANQPMMNGASGAVQMSSVNAQAAGQAMRSGMMPAMPGNMPPQAVAQPMMNGASGAVQMSSVNAQAAGQAMRSGMMPAMQGNMPPQAAGQPMRSGMMPAMQGGMPPQAAAQPMRSGMMPAMQGGMPPQAAPQPMRSGMMPAMQGNMPPQAAGQPMRSGVMPVMQGNMPPQAAAQPMRSGMMPAMQGNMPPQAAAQPMRSGMMPGAIQPDRPARRPDVSPNVAPQARRANMDRPDNGRMGSQSGSSPSMNHPYRQSQYNGTPQPSGSGIAGMPDDAVMASQGRKVMRSLEQKDAAARLGKRSHDDAIRDTSSTHDRNADSWQPGAQDFYGSGVLRDEGSMDGNDRGYAERRPQPERRARQDENAYRENWGGYADSRSSYDSQPGNRSVTGRRPQQGYEPYEEEEPISVPKPRFSSVQPALGSAAAQQGVSSDARRRVVRDTVQATGGESNSAALESVNCGSQPKDVMTGKVRRGGASSSASSEPKNILMTFAQPIGKVFGPERVSEMLHFAAGIWNACLMGADAEEELKNELRDKPNQYKLVQGMIGRKHKYFENEKWLIDELKVIKDSQGHVSLDFLVMNLE